MSNLGRSVEKPLVSVYKKVQADGTLDPRPLIQTDYDQVVDFIKTSFPKATRVQREVEQTLKRTFVLGQAESNKKIRKIKKDILMRTVKTHTSVTRRKLLHKLQNTIPKKIPYSDFIELNKMWKAYAADLLDGEWQPQLKMNRIDFHGAFVEVVHSRCDQLSGLSGIVIKESKNMFVIVTPSNVTKNIPKRETVFDVQIDEPKGTMRICGNSLLTRPSERACKKNKSFMEYESLKIYKSKLAHSK